MQEIKVLIFRKVRDGIFRHTISQTTGKIYSTYRDGRDFLTREDIAGLMDYAKTQCRLAEVSFDSIKIPSSFLITQDRLVDNHQSRALTIVIDRETGIMGWSFCHEGDQFSREAGVLIAANRLANQLQVRGKRVWFTDTNTGESSLLVEADDLADPPISWVLRDKYGIGTQRKGK
jgi:hypothetical protein